MNVVLSAVVIGVGLLCCLLVYALREGKVSSTWALVLSVLSGVGLMVMLLTDWPTDSMNMFWANHSVLAAIASTLLLFGIPYGLWESREQHKQDRLAAGLSGAGLGGIVDHIVDAEVALALLSRSSPPPYTGWDTVDRPLKWMRALRPELASHDDGCPRASDPRSLPVFLPAADKAWRVEITDEALRRILTAMKEWSPLIGRSDDGTTALIILSEIRKDLMELSGDIQYDRIADAEKLITLLRQRLRVLAYFFEDLSRNSTQKSTTRVNTTPLRPEVLQRLWPLPPLDDPINWAADQERVPDFGKVWQRRLRDVTTELGKSTLSLSSMTVAEARHLARTRHAGQVNKQGMDYYEAHLAPIADRLAPYGDEAVIAGLLHDIVEDTDTSLDELLLLGASPAVVRAVDSVTKREGEPYEGLIARAAADPLGRKVKLADNAQNLDDNADLAATDPDTAARLLTKYERARTVLLAAQEGATDGQE